MKSYDSLIPLYGFIFIDVSFPWETGSIYFNGDSSVSIRDFPRVACVLVDDLADAQRKMSECYGSPFNGLPSQVETVRPGGRDYDGPLDK